MQATAPVILIVEDDQGLSRLVQNILENAGYAVEIAADGPTAVARIQAGGCDLVLLDLMLPGFDGLEVCRQARQAEYELHLPIIMLTARTGDEARHAGFLAGADDYVTKPFGSRDLLDRIGVWVRSRRRVKEDHERLLRQAVEAAMGASYHELHQAREILRDLAEEWPDGDTVSDHDARALAALRQGMAALDVRIDSLRRIERHYATTLQE